MPATANLAGKSTPNGETTTTPWNNLTRQDASPEIFLAVSRVHFRRVAGKGHPRMVPMRGLNIVLWPKCVNS